MTAQIPYNKLIALYFALAAAQKGTTRVVISNQHLKQYFIGSRKGERLSQKQLAKFADSLKPVFPKSEVKRNQYGPMLVLYLNDQPDQPRTNAASVWFRDEKTIRKTLGLE
jgi:hypothetical protein